MVHGEDVCFAARVSGFTANKRSLNPTERKERPAVTL